MPLYLCMASSFVWYILAYLLGLAHSCFFPSNHHLLWKPPLTSLPPKLSGDHSGVFIGPCPSPTNANITLNQNGQCSNYKYLAYNLNCAQRIPSLCFSKTELNFHWSFQIIISVTSDNINDLKTVPAKLATPSTPTSSPVWLWSLRASYGIEAWVGWGQRWMGHCSSAAVINSCWHLLRCSPCPSHPLLLIYRGLSSAPWSASPSPALCAYFCISLGTCKSRSYSPCNAEL